MRQRTLAGAIVCLALLPGACTPAQPGASPEPPVTLTIAYPQALVLDANRHLTIPTGEFERLVSYDASGQLLPRVASNWSHSADGLTWRLTMRPDVRFRDGSPVPPAGVAEAILAAARSQAQRANTVCLADIAGAAVDGERDVVIRLTRPCSYLLEELDIAVARTTDDGHQMGTGPYSEVSRQPGEIRYNAHDGYYGGPPAIDRIIVRGYATLREAWAEMMRGQLDVLMDVGPEGIDFFRDQTGVQTVSSVSLNAIAVGLNAARPVFASAEIRRALSLAVDRVELVDQALGGHGMPEDNPVWPAYWALDRTPAPIAFDPAAARRILAGRHVSFTCLVNEDFALWEKVALLVQRQMRAVGVDMRLEPVSSTAIFPRLLKGDFDAAIFDPLGGPYATIQHRFWHSPDPYPRNNIFGYRNVEVDAALDDMRASLDDATFKRALSRFVAAFRADPATIFLVRPVRTQAVSRRFVIPPDAAGLDVIRTVPQWRLARGGS